MALAPDNPNEAFLREVDENLRRDQMRDFAKTYGTWIVVAVVLFLIAVGVWLYWQHRQNEQAARESEQLHALFDDIAANRLNNVPQRLERLEQSDSGIVRATAMLTDAAIALERNDRAGAIASYRELSNDESVPDAYRNAALIRLTALEFDQLKPEQVIARLQPLAKAGEPWFGSAGEMVAMAYLRQNKTEQAGRMFAAIAADQQVPPSLRSRAVQIAGTLGVDASGSLPALNQQD